jgi:signal transduction histidine kinase
MSNALAAVVGPLLSGRMYRTAAYLFAALFLGIGEFVLVVVGASLGISLSIIWIGIPILFGLMAAARAIGAIDRRLVTSLLGREIAPPPSVRTRGGSPWRQMVDLARARSTWRALVWCFLRLPLAVAAWAFVFGLLALGLTMCATPWDALVDAPAWARIVMGIGGVATIILTAHAVIWCGWVHGRIARALLGVSPADRVAVAEARADAADTRTDLARELHDSVGHSVTAAVLQASAARRVLDTDPVFAASALEAIETQGRQALEELDRVLATLREGNATERPSHGLAGLDELISRSRTAGLQITFAQSGDLGRVPDSVGQEMYRIAQEGLTNVMRHASGTTVRIGLAVSEGAVALGIDSDAGTPLEPERVGGGRGLVGIRERVTARGGMLDVGPTPEGGYRLHAELPL